MSCKQGRGDEVSSTMKEGVGAVAVREYVGDEVEESPEQVGLSRASRP